MHTESTKFVIIDWANNHLFQKHEFYSFEDAWGFIYEKFPDEECFDDYYVIPKDELKQKRYLHY